MEMLSPLLPLLLGSPARIAMLQSPRKTSIGGSLGTLGRPNGPL